MTLLGNLLNANRIIPVYRKFSLRTGMMVLDWVKILKLFIMADPIHFRKPQKTVNGIVQDVKSDPVEPPTDALSWLEDFRNDTPVLFHKINGVDYPVHGFSFDVNDVREVALNLNNDNHEIFIGIAKRADDDSHTLILGAVELTKDADGEIIRRQFLYNEHTRRIFDYCDPCPPACPDSIKFI